VKKRANGIEMNYELSGAKDAPVVVLSHSLGSSLAMWDPQMAVLNRRYRVLRYDTRGHGGTEAPPGPYTLDQLGDDALSLLEALGVEAVHWVGLSMGGMIGQAVALKAPARLRSLALCDTSARVPGDAQPLWQERIDRVRKKGVEALVQETMERWFTPAYLRRDPAAVRFIRGQFLATPIAGYIGCSEAIRALDYLDRLPEIETPTLIVVGEEDLGTPVAAAEAMHARIRGSRLVVLPSAAHLSNVEQPEAFTAALTAFLEER